MKINDKMKVVVCGGLAIVLCLIGYSCGSNNENIEEVETEQKQEMQVEEQEELETQEVEEQEIQDESLNEEARNGEYKFEEENQENNLELAKSFIENTARESMSGARYQVITEEESNTVVLIMHIDESSIIQGIMTPQWDELANNSLELSRQGKETLDLMGFTDVNYAVYVGDIDQDSMYFASLNGTLIYNAKDTLN